MGIGQDMVLDHSNPWSGHPCGHLHVHCQGLGLTLEPLEPSEALGGCHLREPQKRWSLKHWQTMMVFNESVGPKFGLIQHRWGVYLPRNTHWNDYLDGGEVLYFMKWPFKPCPSWQLLARSRIYSNTNAPTILTSWYVYLNLENWLTLWNIGKPYIAQCAYQMHKHIEPNQESA